MGSTRPQDRSLGGGISLPQWMKGKLENRFDIDESTFSPPSHDDSFFYIRYPKTQSQSSGAQTEFRPIDHVLSESNVAGTANDGKLREQQRQPLTNTREAREIDFSKHPLPCQPFVPAGTSRGNEATSKLSKSLASGSAKAKSQGTDDGFHGEPALCGKSIVHVANQMMSGKFSKAFALTDQPTMEERQQPKKIGSKSLPATPLASPMASPDSSPKARRKIVSNRYFTGPFIPDRDKYQGGWILASILGQSREIVVPKIDEEDETGVLDVAPPRSLARKKSISSQNLTYIGSANDDEKPPIGKSAIRAKVLQAKPSELREMNFWSPTSM